MSRQKNELMSMMVIGAIALMAVVLLLIVLGNDIKAETEPVALLLVLFAILILLLVMMQRNRPKKVRPEYLMPLDDAVDEEENVQGKMPEDH